MSDDVRTITKSKRSASLVALLAAAVAFGACGRDPEVLKREYVQSGDKFVAEGKLAEAEIEYRNAVQQDARFGEARRKLAETYERLGNMQGAYEQYVCAADVLSNDVDVQVKAGQLLLLAGQFDEAKSRAEKALAIDAKHIPALILRANAMALTNNLDDALVAIEEAIAADPVSMEGYATLGVLQVRKQNLPGAEEAFRKAVSINPQSVEAHLSLGYFLWNARRLAEAEASFLEAAKVDPKDTKPHRVLVALHILARNYKEAEKHLQVLANLPPEERGKFMLANFYAATGRIRAARPVLEDLAKGESSIALAAKMRLAALGMISGNAADTAAASRLVDEVLAKDPSNIDGLLGKTELAARAGKLDDALGSAQAGVKASPSLASAHFALGRVHLLRGESDRALAAFNRARELSPRMMRAQVELAKLHLVAGRLDDAEHNASSAARLVPGHVEANIILSRVYLMKGDTSKAGPIVRALAKALPQSSLIQAELGQLELLEKRPDAARRSFEAAVKTAPAQLDAMAGLVVLDLEAKRYDAVKARLDAALKAAKPTPALLLIAARAYGQMNDPAAMERFAKDVIALDANNLDGYAMLGSLYIRQGRMDEAIAQFSKVAEQEERPVAAYTIVGILLEMQNKRAEAQEKYKRALDVDRNAAVAANNLASMYVEAGDLNQAENLAKTAIAGLPDRPETNDTLAWVYHKKGLHKEAVPYLLRAISNKPNSATYHYHLGEVYTSMGENTKARGALEKSVALDAASGSGKAAQEALAKLKS